MPEPLDRLKAALADRYTIERELGRGGMAIVYLAHDRKLDRDVALKVLRPELAASLGAERFLREIEIAAKLTHPNILPLHDCGTATATESTANGQRLTANILYYTMPFVAGESLRERLSREKQLPIDEALQITKEVADALSHAHALGIVHRDIKPENILFAAGHAVVSDFGIARAVSAAGVGTLTETGLVVGTPAYMSPEQASGAKDVDGRSDIYALGCVLYEMLGGEAPYLGSTPQAVVAKKLSEPAPRVSVVRDTVPAGVEGALARALARTPADRFRTAQEFGTALTRAGVQPAEVATRRRAARLPRLRRWRGAAVAAAVVLLGIGGWWGAHRLATPAMRRLAVLPLASFTNDSTQQYFVQGVHDALIFDLQQAGVSVVGRTSVLQYAHTEKPIRQIARELGVDGVIEGSVLRAGDSVEIALRLIDARTEAARWQKSYPGDVRNILTLYHGVTRGIAGEIRSTLSPEASARLASARRVDPQAYDDYLKGQFHWQRLNPGDLDQALEYFQRALRRDSTYTLAYVGIAWVWAVRAQGFAQGGFASIREAQAQASAAVRKALALDSTLAEVQFIAACVRAWHEWDWTGADAAYRRAIRINPNDADARAMWSHFLYVTGRAAEGRAQIDSAVALDPNDGLCRAFNGMDYVFERRYDEAIAELTRALELGNGLGHNLVETLHLRGARAEALAALREFYAGDQELLAAVNRGYAEGGYRAALHRAADVWASRPPTFWASTFMAARWYALAEDGERTLEWLQRAYELHDPNMPYVAIAPDFDLVRDDPRFKELLRRVGLPNWTATRPS
jgi:TolB-like protein/Tfp pilus assembly protein PilF